MDNEIYYLKLDDIIPNRFQPREIFDESALNELADSIRQHGVIQPIVVRQIGNKYEIIAGERRYKASAMAGLTKIPAIVKNLDDKESSIVAYAENAHRRNVSSIEEARTMERILKNNNMTQNDLANELGLSQPALANKLRLLTLPIEVQDSLMKNEISERHARSLLSLKDERKQLEFLDKIKRNKMTVRELDSEIRNMNGDTQTINNNNIFQETVAPVQNENNNFLNYLNNQNNSFNQAQETVASVQNENNDFLNYLNNQDNSFNQVQETVSPVQNENNDFLNYLNNQDNSFNQVQETVAPVQNENNDFLNYLNNQDNSFNQAQETVASVQNENNNFLNYLNNQDNSFNQAQETVAPEQNENNDFLNYLNNQDNSFNQVQETAAPVQNENNDFLNYLNNQDNSFNQVQETFAPEQNENNDFLNYLNNQDNSFNQTQEPTEQYENVDEDDDFSKYLNTVDQTVNIDSISNNYIENDKRYVDVEANGRITSFDGIINKLKDCIEEIKNSDYKVDSDEIDFGDIYQITIKIDKRDIL